MQFDPSIFDMLQGSHMDIFFFLVVGVGKGKIIRMWMDMSTSIWFKPFVHHMVFSECTSHQYQSTFRA